MAGPMKYYTSEVPAERTVMRIEALLAASGATGILKDFANGDVVAVAFKIVNDGREIGIRLPANVPAVLAVLCKDRGTSPGLATQKLKDQAKRTAWRLMQDWVEVQFALIKMHQVELLQVFLPYAWDGKHTYYEMAKSKGFKMLLAGEPE